MPSGGEDLAAPPVRVWKAAARANLAVLVHGANFYSMGAGGFDKVRALPALRRARQPASANNAAHIRASQIYASGTVLAPSRNPISRQFG